MELWKQTLGAGAAKTKTIKNIKQKPSKLRQPKAGNKVGKGPKGDGVTQHVTQASAFSISFPQASLCFPANSHEATPASSLPRPASVKGWSVHKGASSIRQRNPNPLT